VRGLGRGICLGGGDGTRCLVLSRGATYMRVNINTIPVGVIVHAYLDELLPTPF
jgi:hypothetical protein